MKRILTPNSNTKLQAFSNIFGILSGVCIGLISSTSGAKAAYLGSANAAVNTIGSSSSQTVIPGLDASASYTEPGGRATANANVTSGFTLKTSSNASNFTLSLPGTGSSDFGSGFSIIGNNRGVTIPLTFNFKLQGRMELGFTQGTAFAVNSFSYFVRDTANQNQPSRGVAGSAVCRATGQSPGTR